MRKRENGRRNVFMTKSPRKNVPGVGIKLWGFLHAMRTRFRSSYHTIAGVRTWNQKSCSSKALWGLWLAQNMALNPRYVLSIPGPIGARLTNDWCINDILGLGTLKWLYQFKTGTCNFYLMINQWKFQEWLHEESFRNTYMHELQDFRICCKVTFVSLWPSWK